MIRKTGQVAAAILIFMLSALLAGCASNSSTAENKKSTNLAVSQGQFGQYQPKGFLSDYSKLTPIEGEEDSFDYQNSAVDKSQYNKLMVERIKIWFKEDAEYKGIDPAEIKDLTDYFHKAIVDALGDAYPVVREPGPDVLRLRIAITDLVPNKPEASVVTLVVPYLWIAEGSAGVAQDKAGSTPFVGEVTIEMEALDSQSNQQVAAYIEREIGLKYHWTEGVKTAATDYLKAYSTWAFTKQAMDHWAKTIRTRLDKAHGIAPAKN